MFCNAVSNTCPRWLQSTLHSSAALAASPEEFSITADHKRMNTSFTGYEIAKYYGTATYVAAVVAATATAYGDENV